MLKAIQDSLLSIIYPQQCNVCTRQVIGLDVGVACSDCWSDTRLFTGSEIRCEKCGAYFGEEADSTPSRCHDCGSHHFEKAFSVGVYEKALAAVILELKRTPNIPQRLRTAIEHTLLMSDTASVDVIIPIPLSSHRIRERGFNQAEIIAKAVARCIGVSIDNLSLRRKIHTPAHRVAMDMRARELTVVNAFEVVRPKLIKGKRVLLVDDVLTSGATASSCSKVLKKNGSGEVIVFTLARAVIR